MSKPRKANPDDLGCPHNGSIECAGPGPHCSGWNPAEQQRRVQQWMERMKGTTFIITRRHRGRVSCRRRADNENSNSGQ